MARIATYPDATPTINDKLIGTDVSDNNETKEFPLEDVLSLTSQEVIIVMPSGTTGTYTIPKASWPANKDYAVPIIMINASTRYDEPIPWQYDVVPSPTEIRILIGSGTTPADYYIRLI